MHVAVCDDHYMEVKMIEDYLTNQHIEVDHYESGEAIIAAYRDQGQRYDAVFLDSIPPTSSMPSTTPCSLSLLPAIVNMWKNGSNSAACGFCTSLSQWMPWTRRWLI